MPARGLIHRGMFFHRTEQGGSGPREEVFAKEWEKENKPRRHFLFYVCSTLEGLLSPENDRPTAVSQQTAEAVATIIQWLGTNCGFCFLEETLKRAGYILVAKENYRQMLQELVEARKAKRIAGV